MRGKLARPILASVAFVALAAIVLVGHELFVPAGSTKSRTVSPPAIMGTQTAITVVWSSKQSRRAERAFSEAENALRTVEARMSTYLDLSELSRLNAAPAGEAVKLTSETMAVLRLSKQLWDQTDGAFDVTCLPVFSLWARAGRERRLPADEEVAAAKALCGWDKFELLPAGARKTVAGAGIGLGGVAKGYAIDEAAEVIASAGVLGGLVDVGGDIRCLGSAPHEGPWRVGIRNPFQPEGGEFFGTVDLTAGSVCTSGNYFRFVEIDGKRYSHIIDPRTARPVDLAPSVTVVAPTAAIADAWATALSVLGPDGLKLLPSASGIEAMVVVGGPADYTVHQTPGFGRLLASPVPRSVRDQRNHEDHKEHEEHKGQ